MLLVRFFGSELIGHYCAAPCEEAAELVNGSIRSGCQTAHRDSFTRSTSYLLSNGALENFESSERGLIFFSNFLGRKRLPLLICFLIVSLYIALSLLYNISWLLINLNEIR